LDVLRRRTLFATLEVVIRRFAECLQNPSAQREWIWDHREVLTGQIAEVRTMNVNESGAIRAGVLVRFHSSASEAGPLMYSESFAGGDEKESRSTLYRLKIAAGRKRKA
jgi:hypothetical protein